MNSYKLALVIFIGGFLPACGGGGSSDPAPSSSGTTSSSNVSSSISSPSNSLSSSSANSSVVPIACNANFSSVGSTSTSSSAAVVDLAQPITPFIVVDQFGYLPGAEKVAVVRDPQIGY